MGDSSPLPLGIRSDVPTDATIEIAADAVAPHIRLTIDDLDGTPVDAYGPVIDALFRQVCSVGIGAVVGTGTPRSRNRRSRPRPPTTTATSTPSGSSHSIGAGHRDRLGSDDLPERELRIGPRGALGVREPAGSPDVPASWWSPLDLPTTIWIDLAERDDDRLPAPFLRP